MMTSTIGGGRGMGQKLRIGYAVGWGWAKGLGVA